jgi:flavin-dependent dehydrogenase
VAVELATELVRIEQDGDGVSCDIVKHSVDGYEVEEHIRAEYVVGADGAKGRPDDSLVHLYTTSTVRPPATLPV